MNPGLRKRLLSAVPTAEIMNPSQVTDLMGMFRARVPHLDASAVKHDVSDDDPETIRSWLRRLPVDADTRVDAVWLFDAAGATLRMADLIDHYTALWYPSADDVWVVGADRSWSLLLHHEENFVFEKA